MEIKKKRLSIFNQHANTLSRFSHVRLCVPSIPHIVGREQLSPLEADILGRGTLLTTQEHCFAMDAQGGHAGQEREAIVLLLFLLLKPLKGWSRAQLPLPSRADGGEAVLGT